MAYNKINWENLPSTETPLNEDNLNLMDNGIMTLDEKTLKTNGDLPANTDFNDITETGVYNTTDQTMINAPTTNYTWGFLTVIKNNFVHQIFTKPNAKLIYIREQTGSPLTWKSWRQITTTGDILYDNASGSNGTITLSSSSANYACIEIFFRTNDSVYNSVKVYSPNGKVVSLSGFFANTTVPRAYLKMRLVKINGTSISSNDDKQYAQVIFNASGTYNNVEKSNLIYITKVVGYNN